MDIRVNWKDGKLDQVNVHDATGSHANDLRGGGDKCIAINVYGEDQEVILFLRPAVARELLESLGRMFPVDDPSLRQPSEQVDFPAEVDPVAALKR